MVIEGIKAILTDIEGTTSSISFVHDVLFPYAAEHLPAYVRENENDLGDIFDHVRELENNQNLTTEDIINVMLGWIRDDKKITPLKSLQGMIWKDGYETGAFKGHIYDDAAETMRGWHKTGYPIYIYSSGSVQAQKLIMGHSSDGDLTSLISHYFDTKVGHKREQVSYQKIAQAVKLAAKDIHFFSDVPEELEAAQAAGMQVTQLLRPGTKPSSFTAVRDFSEIKI